MKTIFTFTESIDKRKIILKHDKDVKIYRETRKDHIEWTDGDGNPIENREYIVIRYPKNKKIYLNKWEPTYNDKFSIGFVLNELEDEIELLFYDRVTFGWRIYEIEETGLFKVQQRVIPDWKEYGEVFPCYINARGIQEWTYNIFFGLLQLPFVLYNERQYKKLQTKIQ